MKRFLVVLTILVLVAGFAFAAVSGSVEARYTFDFDDDNTVANYGIYGTNSEVKFTLTTESVTSAGSNKPYATVTVGLALEGGKVAKNSSAKELKYDGYEFNAIADGTLTASLKLSDFRIVGENWEINFLKAIGVGDYAKSAWEIDYTSDKKPLDAPWAFSASKGITVTYEGYKVGLYVDRSKVEAQTGFDPLTMVNLRAESKEIAVAEGITVQAAGALGFSKKMSEDKANADFGFSVKAAYASDAVSASVAADLQNVAEKFDADVAAKVEVAPVTVDAYYATEVTLYTFEFAEDEEEVIVRIPEEDVLSVRAIIDVEKIAPAVPVKVTLYGENLINDGRMFGIKEEGKFGKISEDAQFGIYPTILKELVEDVTIWFANATVGYEVVEDLTVNAGAGLFRLGDADNYGGLVAFKAGATYEAEKFTVDGGLYLGKVISSVDVDDDDLKVSFKASVSSDKLVDNAVLSATLTLDKNGAIGAYDITRSLDDLVGAGDDFFNEEKNTLVLSCKVSF